AAGTSAKSIAYCTAMPRGEGSRVAKRLTETVPIGWADASAGQRPMSDRRTTRRIPSIPPEGLVTLSPPRHRGYGGGGALDWSAAVASVEDRRRREAAFPGLLRAPSSSLRLKPRAM